MKAGDKFGKWTIIEGPVFRVQRNGKRLRKKWKCECVCGKVQEVLEHNLLQKESTQCRDCSRVPLRAAINWRRVSALYSRGHTWEQIAKAVNVDKTTLRMWRRRVRPKKIKDGPRGFFSAGPAFEFLSLAMRHYQGKQKTMLREFFRETAKREVEKLKRRLSTTDQRVYALRARGLEYTAIDRALLLAAGSAYTAARRHEPWAPPFVLETVQELELKGKKWSEINRTIGNPYPSGIILKEVFYFLIEHKIEMDELAGV